MRTWQQGEPASSRRVWSNPPRRLVRVPARAELACRVATLVVGALSLFAATAQAAPGQLDPSFNGSGKLVFNPLGRLGDLSGVAVQPDGKIVLVGSVDNGTGSQAGCGGSSLDDFLVTRLNPDGSPDASFGPGGTVSMSFPVSPYAYFDDRATAVALQPDGKIVVAGTTAGVTGLNCQTQQTVGAVARLNRDGSPDQSFAAGSPQGPGKTLVTSSPAELFVNAVALDASGRILLAGRRHQDPGNGTAPPVDDFFATRLTASGAPDTSYNNGAGATVTVDYSGGFDEADGLAITADGGAVLAGFTDNSAGNADVAVARVTAASGLDAAFGHVTYGYGATSNSDVGQAVAIEPGGRIDVAGIGGVAKDFVLTRLTAAGILDHSLNGGTTTSADFGGNDGANAMALQANGKIVLGGGTNGQQFAIARFQPGGALDSTFGQGGKVTVALPGGDGVALAMALTPDGKIVLAGNSGPSAAVVRLQGDSAAAGGAPAPTGPASTVGPGGGGTGPSGGGTGGARGSVPAVPKCGGKPATIVGTSGNDKLTGTPRADVIAGLGGNDIINAGGGNDIICGGAGNDKLSGAAGNDKLSGGAGNDTLSGGAGNDAISGDAGNDSLSGGSGNDAISGGPGNDSLQGGAGMDKLNGGQGNDRLNGGAGKNQLVGGPGQDSCAVKGKRTSC